jgi:dipeptidyl-peptidase-4
MILIACNSNQFSVILYGRLLFIYNTATKELTKPFDFQVQGRLFSPDGKKIAYAKRKQSSVYDVASKINYSNYN